MIANPSLLRRHRQPASYGLSARQVRHCIALGCVGALVAIPVLCWLVDYFKL